MAQNNEQALNLRSIKRKLLLEKERLEQDLHELIEHIATGEHERVAEMSTFDDHPADMANETFEREKEMAIEGNIEDLLSKINTALEKISEGSYGMCDACGEEINRSRLEALPWASFCRDCQDKIEGR